MRLAQVQVEDGEFRDAIANYKAAFARGHAAPETHFQLAKALVETGEREAARTELETAIGSEDFARDRTSEGSAR